MELPGAQPRHAHFTGKLLHDDACRAWLSTFLDHWLRPVEDIEAEPLGFAQRRVGSSVSTR
jgi:GMP synthase (glutamine-hydrolysing)